MRVELYADLFVSRSDAYARQMPDGRYFVVRQPVTPEVVEAHLRGDITCGWYAIGEDGRIKWACLDCDSGGWETVQGYGLRLAELNITTYPEASRRGGHLWLFTEPIQPRPVRKLLKAVVGEGEEIFPKQDRTAGLGSLVRGPLGIHRKTGERYGFLDLFSLAPVGGTLREELDYLSGVEKVRGTTIAEALAEIDSWRPRAYRQPPVTQDVVEVASQLTTLKRHGNYYLGLCPLHPDNHPSFAVYPNEGGKGRWYCFHEHRGGDAVSLYAEVNKISYGEALKRLKT